MWSSSIAFVGVDRLTSHAIFMICAGATWVSWLASYYGFEILFFLVYKKVCLVLNRWALLLGKKLDSRTVVWYNFFYCPNFLL